VITPRAEVQRAKADPQLAITMQPATDVDEQPPFLTSMTCSNVSLDTARSKRSSDGN